MDDGTLHSTTEHAAREHRAEVSDTPAMRSAPWVGLVIAVLVGLAFIYVGLS